LLRKDVEVEVLWMLSGPFWLGHELLLGLCDPFFLSDEGHFQVIDFIWWRVLGMMVIRQSPSQDMFKSIFSQPLSFISFFGLHIDRMLIDQRESKREMVGAVTVEVRRICCILLPQFLLLKIIHIQFLSRVKVNFCSFRHIYSLRQSFCAQCVLNDLDIFFDVVLCFIVLLGFNEILIMSVTCRLYHFHVIFLLPGVR
jgi:hypothetical protein